MQNFSDATYKNILDYMLSLVPDTYDKRDTSPIQTSLGPAAYVLEGFYLSLDLVQKQAFVQTASGDSLDLLAVLAGITRKQASAAVKIGIFDCADRCAVLNDQRHRKYQFCGYLHHHGGKHLPSAG